MDTVKVVFLSSVIVPLVVTLLVMFFAHIAARNVKAKQKVQQRIINAQGKVIDRQDQLLEEYRKGY